MSDQPHPEHPIAGTDVRPEHPIAPTPPLVIWGGPWFPPGIWPSPGYPAHPIAPGGPPPGIWPDPGYPAHPIAPGGPPPGIWPSPGHPAHPIVIPEPPPEPTLPEPEGGFYVGSANAPVVYVKAGDPEAAAQNYCRYYQLTYGTSVLVATETAAFVVSTDEAEVNQ